LAFEKKAEGTVGLGTDAWNNADGFSKIKILRLIIQLDIDEEIALFGRKDDIEQIDYDELPYRRVEAFQRFIFHLKQLIGNCKFSIEKGYDEIIINQIEDRIEQVEQVIDRISTQFYNNITKENSLVINEEHFMKCFRILQSIKDELNFPLNRASLIFRQSDSLDLDDIMRSVEDGI